MVRIDDVKDFKTLQVTIGTDDGQKKIVTFKFEEGDPSKAEASIDGVNWLNVAVLHQAIAAFIDRYPMEFS